MPSSCGNTATLPIWLTVNAVSGTATAPLSFSTTSVADSMAPGTYSATVFFKVSGYADLGVPVTLLVTNRLPSLSISSTSIPLNWTLGFAPPTTSITVTSTDSPIPYTITTGGLLGPVVSANDLSGLAYSFGSQISVSFNPLVFATAQPGSVLTGTVTFSWGSPVLHHSSDDIRHSCIAWRYVERTLTGEPADCGCRKHVPGRVDRLWIRRGKQCFAQDQSRHRRRRRDCSRYELVRKRGESFEYHSDNHRSRRVGCESSLLADRHRWQCSDRSLQRKLHHSNGNRDSHHRQRANHPGYYQRVGVHRSSTARADHKVAPYDMVGKRFWNEFLFLLGAQAAAPRNCCSEALIR